MRPYIYHLAIKPEYHDASAWDSSAQEIINLHSEFLKRAVTEGRALLVGGTEAELPDNFGVVIFEAENQEDADEFMNSDPAVTRGIMLGRAMPFKLMKTTDQAKKWNIWS